MASARSRSAAETEVLGARLAAELDPGDVVLVSGELGVGKTTLIRGACRELGVEGPVTSPTFTIGHRYRGRVPISHLDLFRLGSLAGEEPGLLDDYLGGDAIAFVEWAGAAEPALEEARDPAGRLLRVAIAYADGDERRITIDRGPIAPRSPPSASRRRTAGQ